MGKSVASSSTSKQHLRSLKLEKLKYFPTSASRAAHLLVTLCALPDMYVPLRPVCAFCAWCSLMHIDVQPVFCSKPCCATRDRNANGGTRGSFVTSSTGGKPCLVLQKM